MPKTLPPGTVRVPGVSTPFVTNVLPDVFDGRDLEYRPRLEPLPAAVDARARDRHVLTQQGSSCTGHALAAMINAVLKEYPRAEGAEPIKVSPYMLYRMARRYDEFEGETDDGSSLRGALKGWFYHGVLPEQDWPSLDDEPEIDLDQGLVDRALEHPLGAFYRVNAFRLDDMQSAVNELSGIVASAVIHQGWVQPTEVLRGEETMQVIERPVDAPLLGGHAFAIVGYNEVGFLVQNSWGRGWGKGGFATLPYDDWLQSAYDAWVARPGVRSVVSSRQRIKLVEDTGGGLSAGPGPDLARLQSHVVNLGNDGRLSTTGRFRSSPAQLDRIFTRMRELHERWRDAAVADGEPVPPRRIVLYAHGGLNSEGTGLAIAQKHVNWWLNNHIYPVTFAWQSGPAEALLDHLTDTVKDKLPFGGLGIDLVEQFDRLVEKLAGSHFRWMWEEMKENATRASGPTRREIAWPEGGTPASSALADLPGATVTVDRLAGYLRSVPDEDVEVHLVGHSAGSIFLTGLLDPLQARNVPVRTLAFLAPAIRLDEFVRRAGPLLRNGSVERFVSFGLSDRRELDDVCGVKGKAVYQKSLLYLVSRGLERDRAGSTDVPLLGMQRFQDTAVAGVSLERLAVTLPDADLVWSPSSQPARSRSDSTSHGGFDDDAPTMTSVLLRILDHDGEPTERMAYEPHTPLLEPEGGPPPATRGLAGGVQEAGDAGEAPVTRMAGLQPGGVQMPVPAQGRLPEEQLAPLSTSPVMDALHRAGWHAAETTPDRH